MFKLGYEWRRKWDFRLCDLPDKMSTGHFSPMDKLLTQFSPYSNPIFIFSRISYKKKDAHGILISLAEKMGFEPMLRYKRTTPLAGEPLEPLGYFSVLLKFY